MPHLTYLSCRTDQVHGLNECSLSLSPRRDQRTLNQTEAVDLFTAMFFLLTFEFDMEINRESMNQRQQNLTKMTPDEKIVIVRTQTEEPTKDVLDYSLAHRPNVAQQTIAFPCSGKAPVRTGR